MHLNINTLGLLEVAYPQDPAFDNSHMAGTSPYQKPNVKIKLDENKNYYDLYELFVTAGDTLEQEPYYSSRHILHFTTRENIVKAITVLQTNQLIPDNAAGQELLAYRDAMQSEAHYKAEITKTEMIHYQYQEEDLNLLQQHLLLKLKGRLNESPQFTADELTIRRAYVANLQALIETQDDLALMTAIESGKEQFSAMNDFTQILLNEGEDVLHQCHVHNNLVYRAPHYEALVKAKKLYSVHQQRNSFSYEVSGDVSAAYPLLVEAASRSQFYLGIPEAQFELGRLFKLGALAGEEKGDTVSQVLHYYGLAAARHHREAIVKLGKMYMFGQGGVSPDIAKGLAYLDRVVGSSVCLWESEPLEYLLSAIDSGHEKVTQYLRNKLQNHQAILFSKADQLVALIKENETDFLQAAENYRYGRNYVMAQGQYSKAGIIHLRQIHYLANRAATNLRFRVGGYVFAKEVLIATYQRLAAECDARSVKHNLQTVIERYQEALAQQIEEQKPKPKTPEEKLFAAIRQDDAVAIKQLFTSGEFKADAVVHSQPLLVLAAGEGSEDVVRLILDQGVNVNSAGVGLSGENALQAVCILSGDVERREEKRLAIARLLIEKGIAVNKDEGEDYTAMHYAALYQFNAMITLLHSKKVKIDPLDSMNRTPLNLLLEQSQDRASPETITILLSCGADINVRSSIESSPWATAGVFFPAILPLLRQFGVPSSEPSKYEEDHKKLSKMVSQLSFIRASDSSSAGAVLDSSEDEYKDESDTPKLNEDHRVSARALQKIKFRSLTPQPKLPQSELTEKTGRSNSL